MRNRSNNKWHCVTFVWPTFCLREMIHELIDTLSKPRSAVRRYRNRGVLCLQVAAAVEHSVIQQVSSESSGGRRQADKILIAAEALRSYLSYRGSYLLALTQPDNDPFATGISVLCGGNNLLSLSVFLWPGTPVVSSYGSEKRWKNKAATINWVIY